MSGGGVLFARAFGPEAALQGAFRGSSLQDGDFAGSGSLGQRAFRPRFFGFLASELCRGEFLGLRFPLVWVLL